MKMILKFQSSIGPGFLKRFKIWWKFWKFSKFSKFFEIKKEKRREEKREGSCSTSYSSGNQVDGLPFVAIRVQFQLVGARKNVDLFIKMGGIFFELMCSFFTIWTGSIFPVGFIQKADQINNQISICSSKVKFNVTDSFKENQDFQHLCWFFQKFHFPIGFHFIKNHIIWRAWKV